ncbi:MAG: anti-sigma factor [Alphaproteobacteria bacterium]
MSAVIAYEGLPPLSQDSLGDYLAAWLDGVLDDATAERVDAMVKSDPAAARLAEQMRALDRQLPHAFAGVMRAPVPLALARAAGPVPVAPSRPRATAGGGPDGGLPSGPPGGASVTPLRRPPRTLERTRTWVMAAAAGALIAAVGIPLAYRYGIETGVVQEAETDLVRHGWLTQVAQYHRAYSAESRHLVEVPAAESEHITAWLGERLDRPFAIPDLAGQGLDFRGARMLIIDGKPVAQLMYAQDDAIFGLCFLATDGADAGFSETTRDELGLVSWRDAGYAFVVVGPSSTGELLEIAESARAQI